MSEHDTSEPILVLVRRGRNGRGFLVSPVEDPSNAAVCATDKEIGESIIEMLNDPNQPRVNMNDILAVSAGCPPDLSAQDNKREPEEDDSDIGDVLGGNGDLADKILFHGISAILNKGRGMSSSRVRPSGPRQKKKRG